jgi:hypothetical protein
MRCPSCGTDNAPDSRFCGGCGARFGASAARVAPTQKIADDASFPPRHLAPGGSAVPVTAPGVVPPRAIPAAPFMPHNAPPAQRPLGVGSIAPRPIDPTGPRPAGKAGVRPPRDPASPIDPTGGLAARPAGKAVGVPTPRDPGSPIAQPPLAQPAPLPPPPSAPMPAVYAAPAARPPRPQIAVVDEPSLSLPMPARRPWALIFTVLVIDLGLAVTGAWLLMQGLR